ncbi:MAG: YihA family ribosome biogenesis GTP-binding protein [Flavobacteriales bacterium]|nr:YihA family ribosome biogenesis GTP-binding protein [Flavobacteriales bacterium]
MQIKSATFVQSYPEFSSMPEKGLPEFAFIGRSNVGKSSLINMLTERKDLAKTSSKPGKTRLINSFLINGEWNLIDLPGYGFAQVSRKTRARFGDMIQDYLKERRQLHCAFVLIDSRIPPQAIDLEFLDWCAISEVPIAIVLTKTDKSKNTQNQENRELLRAALFKRGWEELPELFESSAVKRNGRTEILTYIDRILNPRTGN